MCSSPTHSAPKGNISLDNTDMINADFYVWPCAISHVRGHNVLQVLGSTGNFKGCCMV